jgi:hypothetical protein
VELLKLLEDSLHTEVSGVKFNYLSLAGGASLLPCVRYIIELGDIHGPPSRRRISVEVFILQLVPQALFRPELRQQLGDL